MKALFFLVALLLASTGPVRAGEVEDVQAQTRAFYHWNVHGLNAHPAAEPRKTAAIHRYVSDRFLREVARLANGADGLEADPFLCGQDWDPDWEKNIRVKDMAPAGPRWKVQVELTGKQMAAHRLNLVLMREGGTWKIDKVSDGDTR